MVHKCANPDCSTEFKYFREGRLFEFTVNAGSYTPLMEASSKGEARELFWLCKNCAQQLTLECDQGSLVMVPRRTQAA